MTNIQFIQWYLQNGIPDKSTAHAFCGALHKRLGEIGIVLDALTKDDEVLALFLPEREQLVNFLGQVEQPDGLDRLLDLYRTNHPQVMIR